MSDTNVTTISERAVAAQAPQMSTRDEMASLMAMLGDVEIVQVTRTVLQQKEGKPYAVEFQSAAYQGEVLESSRGSGAKMAPARLAEVRDLVTGSLHILIMNTVLEGELARKYPDERYVGKSFIIRATFPTDTEGKKKRYRVYEIAEIVPKSTGEVVATPVADGSDPINAKGHKPKG